MPNKYPIYCINLEHRKDRLRHSISQFKNLGISHNTVIYPFFKKDPRGGIYGCFDSHIKIWNDFFINHPNDKYALIFEDDFVTTNNSKSILENATKFIDNNCDKIDILFLHNIYVNLENTINDLNFTCGYGLATHSYFITRHYIKSIIDKYGKLPEPNGRHIDFEIGFNIIDNDNKIYSNKLFFSKEACFTQLVDKSDNYLNIIDEMFRFDINKQVEYNMNIFKVLKKMILNDNQIKIIQWFMNYFGTVKMNNMDKKQDLLKGLQLFFNN
jgi:GR25 family glycosyltransferase involved in LPS biosynthesis